MPLTDTLHQYLNSNNIISLSLNKDLKNQIKKQTEFLDLHYSKIQLRTRVYVLVNNITESTLPKCKCGCGKFAAINQTYPENGFRLYSGPECSRKSKTVSDDILCKLDNYEWIYDQKITQQKSIEQIADTLKISTTPVVKYLKKFNLYRLNDARNRNSASFTLLRDKEKLQEYYESGLTCEEVAEKLSTTKGTVSRWLSIHQIQTREPNSYERKIKKVSREENSLYDYVCSIYDGEVIQSNRSVLNGKELDIYLPHKNLAIEYNGLYSHYYRPHESTDAMIKDKKYHLQKTLECEKKGIQLLQVFSDEWNLKQSIVKSIISSKLNLNSRIYARNCEKVIVSAEEKNLFLTDNHIQGQDKSRIKLGLRYNNELVSVMTFCKSRFNSQYEWELSRFSTKSGLNVVGGFSRLLKWFREQHSGCIVSYADRRYSNGNVYFKNGFSLIRVNEPSYYYVDKNCLERFNRMRFQRKYIGAYDCTEYEKAREMGYNKIFDCGTLTFGLS